MGVVCAHSDRVRGMKWSWRRSFCSGQSSNALTRAVIAWFNLRSVAAMMNGNGTSAQQILALTAAFRDRGLSFRYFPLAQCAELRWQAGREVVEPITLPDGDVRFVHRFELVGWASTSGELINQLASG